MTVSSTVSKREEVAGEAESTGMKAMDMCES